MLDRKYYKLPRVYWQGELGENMLLDLTSLYNYLCNVLRLREKSQLRIFNAAWGEYIAEIVNLGKKSLQIRIISLYRLPEESEQELRLIFAPIRAGRLEFMVEKATEMGVTEFIPIVTERSQHKLPRLDRLEKIIVEAAEQSERLTVPTIREIVPLDKLLHNWQEGKIIFADENLSEARAATQSLLVEKERENLLIGPEGGFSEQEREILYKTQFIDACGFGNTILRSETAALFGISVINYLRKTKY